MSNTKYSKSNPSVAKKLRLPAAMLVGGLTVGSFFAPIDLASAQNDATTESSADADSEVRGHRGDGRTGKGQAVEELLGLSRDELKTAFDEGKTLAEVATEQGITVDDLVATMVAGAQERIDAAVEAGKLDAEEAAEKSAAIAEKITEKVNAAPGEHANHGERGNRTHGPGGLGRVEALEELGLTAEALTAGREAEQTLAETAAANGIAEADLIDALVATAEERISEAVTEGKIDEDTAAEKTAGLAEHIAERVNAEPGEPGESGKGQHGKGQRGKGQHGGGQHGGGQHGGSQQGGSQRG